MDMIILDWVGSLFAITGALLFASYGRFAPWGWIFFLLSNFTLITVALNTDQPSLYSRQFVFMATSLLGLYRSPLVANVRT